MDEMKRIIVGGSGKIQSKIEGCGSRGEYDERWIR